MSAGRGGGSGLPSNTLSSSLGPSRYFTFLGSLLQSDQSQTSCNTGRHPLACLKSPGSKSRCTYLKSGKLRWQSSDNSNLHPPLLKYDDYVIMMK